MGGAVLKKVKTVYIIFVVSLSLYLTAVLLDAYISQTHKSPKISPKDIKFNQQFLHPYYFFSFPTRPELLEKLNNKDNWVDVRGFRGYGPEKRGDRKLAFLLGGSTAFGDGAETNEKTITAVLNRIQSQYFFVNTGVPSWNSFQELLRYLKQIQNEDTALVISLSGFNDFWTAFLRKSSTIPPDSPESFEDLNSWVEDIRSPDMRENAVKKYIEQTSIFRHFRLVNVLSYIGFKIENLSAKKDHVAYARTGVSQTEWVHQTVDRYLENMTLIKNYSDFRKSKFIVFFQPFLFASKEYENPNVVMDKTDREFRKFFLLARADLKKRNLDFVVDMSEPFQSSSLNPTDFFEDQVHFNNEGYEFIARMMWSEIQARDKSVVR